VKNLFVLHAFSHQKYWRIKCRYYATSCFAKNGKYGARVSYIK